MKSASGRTRRRLQDHVVDVPAAGLKPSVFMAWVNVVALLS